jgi:hypothetical protein
MFIPSSYVSAVRAPALPRAHAAQKSNVVTTSPYKTTWRAREFLGFLSVETDEGPEGPAKRYLQAEKKKLRA